MADLIDEALPPGVTVHERSNTAASLGAAINAGHYEEWNSLTDTHINFDRNLGAKTGNPNQYGEARFRTRADGTAIDIYIVLGPGALQPVGPQFTKMAFDHETAHARDYLLQWAVEGVDPHSATAGEELAIYAEGFTTYFLDLWTIDNAAPSFQVHDSFPSLFSYYPAATAAEKDDAFERIKTFYEVRVANDPCNRMKFRIWFQMMRNANPGNALVGRINALPGLGLGAGTAPATHFDPALGCG